MTEQEGKALLAKYDQGLCNADERALVESWYLKLSSGVPQMEGDVDYDYWYAHIKDNLPVKRSGSFRLWPKIAVAAAAVAAITLGTWLYYTANTQRHAEFISASQQDVAPGKNGATITLANGKIIQLSDTKSGVVINDNKLIYDDGGAVEGNLSPAGRGGVARETSGSNPLSPEVNSGQAPQGGSLPEGEKSMMLTASTSRGQTYQFTLPDRTKVWLNAASKISFPSQFSGKEREILLEGEAYFEVVKDKMHPFIVQTDKQEVTVLGTHFNINSYTDETNTKTTLLEGSIRVSLLRDEAKQSPGEVARSRGASRRIGTGSQNDVVLKPSQQSTLTGYNRIDVQNVDAREAVAWKNGFFQFEDASVETVLRQLARWYDVEIVYTGKMPERSFTGKIYRDLTASEALRIMKFTKVKFKIEGKKIMVTP